VRERPDWALEAPPVVGEWRRYERPLGVAVLLANGSHRDYAKNSLALVVETSSAERSKLAHEDGGRSEWSNIGRFWARVSVEELTDEQKLRAVKLLMEHAK
jgi:hypothetical protein